MLKMYKVINKLVIILNVVPGFLTIEDNSCIKHHTLLEISGDAMISVFVDINYGPYCNETSLKGFQEISAAVHVVRTLNMYDYVPEMSIGLRVFDTCYDKLSVYKQTLMAVVNLECAANYELGVLAPSTYSDVFKPFKNYSLLPINFYTNPNFTDPLMKATLNFISSKFEIIDLLLTSSSFYVNQFFDIAKEHGICVKNYKSMTNAGNLSEIVIMAIGYSVDIRLWIENYEERENQRVKWIILPLDDTFFDDVVPVGSYVVKSDPIDFSTIHHLDSIDEFLEVTKRTITYSPFLLNMGKHITESVQILQNLKKTSCSHDSKCVLPHFNTHPRPEMAKSEIYETLHIPNESQYVKYIIIKKTDENEFLKVAEYKIDTQHFKSTSEEILEKMPNLCLQKLAKNCNQCINFQQRTNAHGPVVNEAEEYFLRSNKWVPIYLTIVSFGTFASIIIVIFIVYRYFTEQVLDGNPILTIVLVLANIFLMQTVFPFCMNDDFLGPEHLNSRKIFVTTLSFGLVFSIILSRAFFLAFSTGGMFTGHINGYLQSLMIFFMFGIQVAISTMYFFLSESNSAIVIRSIMFIALLSYDIFLLLVLFIICCFIAHIQRNYREGKCFFATVLGLLVIWVIWLTSFILMEPEVRDIIVCFGIISTAVLIIIGILIPRTYYMVTRLKRDKTISRRFEPMEFGPDPRMNTVARQFQQSFYEYVRPVERATSFTTLSGEYPNYYGSSSPNTKYFDQNRQPEIRRSPGYNNYGFHSEMREMENAYVVPRVYIENPEGCKSTISKSELSGVRMQQRQSRKPKLVLQEKDCVETDIYVEDRLSPTLRGPNERYPSRCSSPKLNHVDATIQEEDEYEEKISRITRF